jgi:hypothetical protein
MYISHGEFVSFPSHEICINNATLTNWIRTQLHTKRSSLIATTDGYKIQIRDSLSCSLVNSMRGSYKIREIVKLEFMTPTLLLVFAADLIEFYSTITRKSEHSIRYHSLVFVRYNDDSFIYQASKNTLALYSISTRRCIHKFTAHLVTTTSVAICRNSIIYQDTSMQILMYNLKTHKQSRLSAEIPRPCTMIVCGTTVICATRKSKKIYLYNILTQKNTVIGAVDKITDHLMRIDDFSFLCQQDGQVVLYSASGMHIRTCSDYIVVTSVLDHSHVIASNAIVFSLTVGNIIEDSKTTFLTDQVNKLTSAILN